MSSGPVTVLAAALELAEEGLPVFPVQQDKRPYTVHGFKEATTDPRQITAWWRRWPGALVGVPTGRASGILVIDIDPEGAEWHRENDHRLACGRVHRTPRGHHLLYRYPSNGEIRNSAGRIAPGVDVRGEGGYIVWWPAHGFARVGGMEDLTARPELPLTNEAAPHTGTQEAGEHIAEGHRNDFLSREAYRLRKQGCNSDQITEVLGALNNARCSPPLPHAEVVGIASGKARVAPDGAGQARPYDALPPLEAYVADAAQEDARRHTAGVKAAGGDKVGPDTGAAPGGGVHPSFLTAAKLWNMKHDPTRWAVPEVLPDGVTILGGKPKVGKSWLALDLALAVGTGGRALGAIKVEAGPVLYLALEDTKRRLTKRLRILCGNSKPPPEQIEFLTDCPRLGSGGEEVLRAWLRDHPTARLVVIDTLPRFRPPTNAKETLYANDYVVGEYLGRLCIEHQVSILLLGHLRKQPGDDPIDEISGTLGLVGSVDGYMVLRRQAMSDEATLYVCGRDVDEPAERCLSWDRPRARWSITGGDPRVSRLPAEQRRVYDLLSQAPRTMTELAEALNPGDLSEGDQKYKNASKLVYKLRDSELVFQRSFDKRWALSTQREGEEGEEREGEEEGEKGEDREDGSGGSSPCSPTSPCDFDPQEAKKPPSDPESDIEEGSL